MIWYTLDHFLFSARANKHMNRLPSTYKNMQYRGLVGEELLEY